MTIVVFVSVAVGVTATICIAFGLFDRDQHAASKRFRRALENDNSIDSSTQSMHEELGGAPLNSRKMTRIAKNPLRALLSQSGVSVSYSDLILILCGSALLCGLSCIAFKLSLPVSAILAALAPLSVLFVLLLKRKERRRILARQLPDAFEVMGRALRASQSVASALQIVAKEFPGPVGDEFTICSEKQNLGIPFETALRDLAVRTGLPELRIFSTALILNQQLGGNLAEVNMILATAMRKREQFHARVKAITGEGRMQAMVLTILPIAAFVGIFFVEREYVQVLFGCPHLIAGALISQLTGAVIIHRIVHFHY